MSDELSGLTDTMRRHAAECHEEYEKLLAAGEALTYQSGRVANFASVYMASRLLHNGYADTFTTREYVPLHVLAEDIRNYIEHEMASGITLPEGQFALDLAFLMLNQVEWWAVAKVLQEQITEREKALLLLRDGDEAVIPSIDSQPTSPEEWQRLTGQNEDGGILEQR